MVGYYRAVSRFYDLELAERGDEELWRRVGRAAAGRRILELGAGSGRATALLAAGGARFVLALDLSPDMLARARGRLAGRENVGLVQADMRAPPLRGEFDLIVAADDPFSHLIASADRQRALTAAAELLAGGGRLILDALWLNRSELAARAGDGRAGERRVADRAGREMRVREHWRCDPRSHRCRASYAYSLDGAEVEVACFEARAWTAAEVRRRFAAAGLTIERWSGDYQGGPWEEARSRRLVVEARRTSGPAL
ncbi:MAG TPA: class I SAM-dependent methyltransferase [Chloroflexota bacterium]